MGHFSDNIRQRLNRKDVRNYVNHVRATAGKDTIIMSTEDQWDDEFRATADALKEMLKELPYSPAQKIALYNATLEQLVMNPDKTPYETMGEMKRSVQSNMMHFTLLIEKDPKAIRELFPWAF
jgi:hypothetical protein